MVVVVISVEQSAIAGIVLLTHDPMDIHGLCEFQFFGLLGRRPQRWHQRHRTGSEQGSRPENGGKATEEKERKREGDHVQTEDKWLLANLPKEGDSALGAEAPARSERLPRQTTERGLFRSTGEGESFIGRENTSQQTGKKFLTETLGNWFMSPTKHCKDAKSMKGLILWRAPILWTSACQNTLKKPWKGCWGPCPRVTPPCSDVSLWAKDFLILVIIYHVLLVEEYPPLMDYFSWLAFSMVIHG